MLGIDIGGYSVKAAVVKTSRRGRATIEHFTYHVLPERLRGGRIDANGLNSIVAEIIKEIGRGQKRLAFAVPVSSVILKTIEVDSGLDETMIEGEVQVEMVNFVPFPLDQVYMDYVVLDKPKSNSSKQEVFVAVSRRDIVDKIAGSIESKAISSKEVDVDVFAIAKVLQKIKGDNYRGSYGVLDIGYQSTVLSVFKDGIMLFNRSLQIGGDHLTKSIAEATGVSVIDAEITKHENIHSVPDSVITSYFDALAEQISLAIELFESAGSDKLSGVYLTGGGSFVDGIIENLGAKIANYKFKILPIGQDISISKKIDAASREEVRYCSAVASGLAMRK